MIRLLNPKDLQSFKSLRLTSLKTDPGSFVSTYEYENKFSDSHFVNRLTQNHQPPFGIYGSFRHQELIGYVQMTPEWFPKISHIANLYELYVLPKFRNQGIATQLVNYTIQKILKETTTIEQIHLRVSALNSPALRLYKNLDFRHIATRPNAIKHSDKQYDHEYFLAWYRPKN